MVTLEEVVETIEKKSNFALAMFIKNDILSDEKFGLDLNQARFLLEVANRLEKCDDYQKQNGPG